MIKTTFTKKRVVVLFMLILVLMIAYAVFRVYNPRVNFAYFEPSYLPPNISIKEKRISITEGYIRVEQNFRTEDWVYAIEEDSAGQSTAIGDADQNYNPKSIKPTCMIQKTPAQTRYRLCHWIDYGRIDVHEITFIKDGTRIYSQMPSKTDQNITIDQIEKYIDSFQRKSTLGFPVLRSSGA